MSAGYGRGYYGAAQLEPQAPKRGGGGWIKLAVVVGVGAVVWYMWPRKPKPEYVPGPEPKPPALPSPPFEAPPMQITSGSHGDYGSAAPVGHGGYGVASGSGGLVGHAGYGSALGSGVPDPQLDQIAQSRGYASQKAYEDAVVATAKQLQDEGAKVSFAPHLQHLTPLLGTA